MARRVGVSAVAFVVGLICFVGQWADVGTASTGEIIGDELFRNEKYYESGPFGGLRGGAWFTDFYQSLDGLEIQPRTWPSTINVRAGGRIDAIQVFYGPYPGGFHGGQGGKLHKIRLYEGDRINRITGKRGLGPGAGIDQLTFYTINGKKHGPYGGDGGYFFDASAPEPNCYLAWISGRADLRLDSVTFHWRCARSALSPLRAGVALAVSSAQPQQQNGHVVGLATMLVALFASLGVSR